MTEKHDLPKKTRARKAPSKSPATMLGIDGNAPHEPIRTTNQVWSDAGSDTPNTPPTDRESGEGKAGDNRLPAGIGDPLDDSRPSLPLACVRDGETKREAWERIRKEGRAAGLSRRDAYDRATREAERLFPPVEPEPNTTPATLLPEPEPIQPTEPAPIAVAPAPIQVDEGVPGLGDMPAGWPELPANASLQVEIAWVSANRLKVRSGQGVDLSKALSPAPSYAALSWLETSILFPAKFADISVKATSHQDDEKEHIRREKIAIEEMRSILSEMLEARE